MLINWTKIIILIIIIGAFAGIIVGIVMAFRSQCPDGKIFDKKCKKCVTKCEDGEELPNNKDGDRDCDSETCQKICPEDSCRVDSETCGEPCVNKQECCGPGETCYPEKDSCQTKNCGDIHCDLTIPKTKCSPGGICSNGAVPCDDKDTVKCDNGLCCPKGSKCLKGNNIMYCCPQGDVLSSTGCCPSPSLNKSNNFCCQGDQHGWAEMCCPQEDKCYDLSGNEMCCNSSLGYECKPYSGNGKGKTCKRKCGTGSDATWCTINQFCDDTGGDQEKPACKNDPCKWRDVVYTPKDLDGGMVVCIPNEDQEDVSCNNLLPPKNSAGVWKIPWIYNDSSSPSSIPYDKNDGLACRKISVISDDAKNCTRDARDQKLAQKYLANVTWDVSNNIGKLTGYLDCTQLLKNQAKKVPPLDDRCFPDGVCCKPKDKDNSGNVIGGKCGTWCIADNEYCLIDPNSDYDKLNNIICNGNSSKSADGSTPVSSTNKDFCKINCKRKSGGATKYTYYGKYCENSCKNCWKGVVTTGTEGSQQGYTCEKGAPDSTQTSSRSSVITDTRYWGTRCQYPGNMCSFVVDPDSDDPGVITGSTCSCACVSDDECCGGGNHSGSGVSKIPTATNQPSIPASSCFTGNSLITMADGSTKRIDSFVGGEMVRSGLDPTKSTEVWFLEISRKSTRQIVGFNGVEPFSTFDHTFIGENTKRVCFDPKDAMRWKHWSDVPEKLKNGIVLSGGKVVSGIRTKKHTGSVYALATNDHTYIVNGFAVHDDVAEYHKHLQESMILFEFLKYVLNKVGVDKLLEERERDGCSKILDDEWITYEKKLPDDSTDLLSFEKSVKKLFSNIPWLAGDPVDHLWKKRLYEVKNMIRGVQKY